MSGLRMAGVSKLQSGGSHGGGVDLMAHQSDGGAGNPGLVEVRLPLLLGELQATVATGALWQASVGGQVGLWLCSQGPG